MEKHFRVSWEIDIWAETAEQAAEKALEIQRDPESTATVFECNDGETTYKVDLMETPGLV